MSMNSINSVEGPTSTNLRSQSKVFFSNVTRSQKSATISNTQMSRSNRPENPIANTEDLKYTHYPSPASSYLPKKSPPDLASATKHRISHGVAPLESLLASTEACESTGVPFTNRKIPLLAPISQLYHLGPVFPMYFLLIKQISIIMIFLCILAAAIAILQFKSVSPPQGYIDYISILYSKELQTTVLIMGSLCILLALFFILHRFRKRQKFTKMRCKVGNLSPSDYTVISENLADSLSEEELKSFFSNFIVPGFSLDVVKVTKTCDIDRYIWEIRRLSKLINKKEKLNQNPNKSEKASLQIEDLDREIEESNQFFLRRKTFLSNFKLLRRNDICFVTFNTRLEAKAVKRRFELSPVQRALVCIQNFISRDVNEYCLNGNFVKIQKAPEPGEIIWENMRKPTQSFCFVITYLILCLIVFAITAVGLWQLDNLQLSYVGWCIGLLVAVTNELMYSAVYTMALWENFLTITEKRITLTHRLVFLQVINMILPVYILDILQPQFNPTALPFYLLCISIVSFALPLIIRLINPRYILKSFSRLRARLQGTKCPLTQEEANYLFEDPELNISALYSNLLKTLMFSCFSFPVSPGVAFVGLIALIFMYWIDKYNLLRKSLIPSYMRSELSEAMNECLDVALFLLALGNLVWSLMMLRNLDGLSDALTIMLGASIFETLLTFVYMLLPNKKINRGWFPLDKKASAWSGNLFYQQAIDYFPTNYTLFSLPSEQNMGPQDLKEKYKNTHKKFNCIESLQDCPEILSIFEYADKHPSFFQIWLQGLEGLKDPYYIYPQNYGYGLVQLLVFDSENQKDNKIPLLQEAEVQRRKKGSNTIFSSNFMKRNTEMSTGYPGKRDTRDLVNMMTEMVSTAHDYGDTQKASTLCTQRPEELKSQDQYGRKKQDSDAHNTLIFDSFRNEILTVPGSENSILGMSPIIEPSLLKGDANTGNVNRK